MRHPSHPSQPVQAAAAAAGAELGTLWQGFLRRLVSVMRVVHTRQALLEMDPRMLKDIGITHADAVQEARRMPWDLAPPPRPDRRR